MRKLLKRIEDMINSCQAVIYGECSSGPVVYTDQDGNIVQIGQTPVNVNVGGNVNTGIICINNKLKQRAFIVIKI